MLEIAGGAYLERCLEPQREEFYGSGLRAAIAVSRLCPVRLHAFTDKLRDQSLTIHARAHSIEVVRESVPHAVVFTYSHPLSTPLIAPAVGHIPQGKPLLVRGSAVLRFGMLEGTAVVSGGRVVYDPQSPFDPRPFHENGSTAKELAIVSNGRESAVLTGLRDPDRIVRHLMSKHRAAVVVIKRGPHGASVYWQSGSSSVSAFKTDRVWKIGSGDVFAAAFACYWAEKRMPPREAAKRASAAAAAYCGELAIPLRGDFYRDITNRLAPIRIAKKRAARRPLVYLAGPFFTMAQRWLINEARNALLMQGARVFSPLHDVGHGAADDVVPADLDALDKATAVFGIVDGIDAGTVFEVGYATAKGIPVVAFVQNEHAETLKMLHGSRCEVKDDFASAIYSTVWAALSQ